MYKTGNGRLYNIFIFKVVPMRGPSLPLASFTNTGDEPKLRFILLPIFSFQTEFQFFGTFCRI